MDIYTIQISDAENANKFIIYRPLIGLAFVGNKAMADLAQSLAAQSPAGEAHGEAVDFLHQIGFLNPDPPHPVETREDFKPTIAVLLLTNQCQLRCTYCYAAAGESRPQVLSVELGQAVIDQACQNAQQLGQPHFDVSFHGGGEPTLAWQTLTACVEYARQKTLPAAITLTSNGVWPEKKREWLLDHLDSLSLSMDGGPQTQNRNRPAASGKASSGKVMKTIEALDQRGFHYGIRMTAIAPWDDFPRDVRFLCEETQCPSMQVEPAFNTQRGGHNRPSVSEARAFADAYLEAADIAAQHGRHLSYSGARIGQVTTTFCSAPYQALVVNALGNLVACYEVASETHPLAELSTIGQVENGAPAIDAPARNRLHDKIAERRAACRDCFCYWSCAGDCYSRAFLPGEGGHLQRSARCELNRYLLERLLLNKIAEGNGLWFSGRQDAALIERTIGDELVSSQ